MRRWNLEMMHQGVLGSVVRPVRGVLSRPRINRNIQKIEETSVLLKLSR